MITNIVLIALCVIAIIFAPWIGPVLSKLLIPIISNPYGAVFAAITLVIVLYNLIQFCIGLGRVGRTIR